MKNIINNFVVAAFVIVLCFSCSISVMADVGNPNIESGGGGMGSGTSTDFWSGGDDGVRVTIVKSSDGSSVSTPIDFTNKKPDNIIAHFGKVSKSQYRSGASLSVRAGAYQYHNPALALPRIIPGSGGGTNINEIRRYFCSEYTLKMIAGITGMNYDTLVNGSYKILLEPIAYVTFGGIRMAMTATEAALYDQLIGGGMRSRMPSLSHQNLPLSMFLEVSDLGYGAWGGSTTGRVSNADIIASLGIGIVRFTDLPADVGAGGITYDYEYRVDTDVITSVTISGGQSDPDRPVSVRFNILGTNYSVSNVYYPLGDSQLAWVRWRTPATPQTVTISVTVTGGGSASQNVITARITDLSQNDPPNPVADDRNNSFTHAGVPSNAQKTSATWNVWRPWWQAHWVWHPNWVWVSNWVMHSQYFEWVDEGWWEDRGRWVDEGWWRFAYDSYSAGLSASMNINPDARNPTASGKTMKSGYGISQNVSANVSTNQSSAVTVAQNAVTYFPEFRYQTYWRLLDRADSGLVSQFEFKRNEYSTYNRRTHFTPIWMPDGTYRPYTWLIDCWTPVGMLSMNLTDSVTISGNLWADWHISPMRP